jgi:hypothetical protein
MNLSLAFIPNPTNTVLNTKVQQTLQFITQEYKIPHKVIRPDELNTNLIRQGFYVVLVTEREPEPLNDTTVTYVRTRWNDEKNNFSLQYYQRFEISEPKDSHDFIIKLLSLSSNRDMAYAFGSTSYVFCMPDKRSQSFPFQRVIYNITYKIELRIKPICSWTTTEHLIKMWSHMERPGVLKWVADHKIADFFIVVNGLNDTSNAFDPSRTLYFLMEPEKNEITKMSALEFVTQVKPMFVGLHKTALNLVEPHVKNVNSNIVLGTKRKALSVIISNRYIDPGHKYRIDLVRLLDDMSEDERGYPLHIYGKCKDLKFRNYHGELPEHNKDAGLNDYMYHLNVENHYIENYITEKLWDPIFCQTLCFYFGCPNVNRYVPEKAYIQLPALRDEENLEALLLEKKTEFMNGKGGDSLRREIMQLEEELKGKGKSNRERFAPMIRLIRETIESNTYEKVETQKALQLARHCVLSNFSTASRVPRLVRLTFCNVMVFEEEGHEQRTRECRRLLEEQGFQSKRINVFKEHPMKRVNLQYFVEIVKACARSMNDILVIDNVCNELVMQDISIVFADIVIFNKSPQMNELDIMGSTFYLSLQGAEKVLSNLRENVFLFKDVAIRYVSF